jgi:hypothetical protein
MAFVWRIWTGPVGTVQTELQYTYVERTAYGGKGGAPAGIENMVSVNIH